MQLRYGCYPIPWPNATAFCGPPVMMVRHTGVAERHGALRTARRGIESGRQAERKRIAAVAACVGHGGGRKMRLLGLEPKTYGLKVRCSTD